MKFSQKFFLNSALALSLTTSSAYSISVPSVLTAIPVRKIAHGAGGLWGAAFAAANWMLATNSILEKQKQGYQTQCIFGCVVALASIDSVFQIHRLEKLEKEKSQASSDAAAQAKLK